MTAYHSVIEAESGEGVASEVRPGNRLPIVALVGRLNTGKLTFPASGAYRSLDPMGS